MKRDTKVHLLIQLKKVLFIIILERIQSKEWPGQASMAVWHHIIKRTMTPN
jgi:hypothetical protein